jgi:hypothetical protein
MKREEQVMLIMQIIQKQRRKNPTASELELLANTKTVCKLLVASEDLEKEVVDESLAIVFETERALLEKRRKEEKELEGRKGRSFETTSTHIFVHHCAFVGG